MSMEKLDLPDNSIDFIYSSLALHYLPDWNPVFSEACRLLKPGGQFLFSCNHPVHTAMADVKENERRLSISSERESDDVNIVGDYLNRQPVNTDFGSGIVITWHKPFGEIINEATSHGFLLENVVEPKPLEKMKELRPKDYAILSKIPEFIICRFIKN